jgi:MFS family permease
VYAEPLSRQAGHAPTVAGVAVSLSLAFQVLGGVVATVLAGRVRWFPALMLCAVIYVGCLLAFAALPSESLYLATSSVFGFLWMFSLPFFVPMVIAADPTRRAALLVGGAELAGGSLGPLFASFVVTDVDVRGSLGFGAFALVVTIAIAFALHRRERALPATIVEI